MSTGVHVSRHCDRILVKSLLVQGALPFLPPGEGQSTNPGIVAAPHISLSLIPPKPASKPARLPDPAHCCSVCGVYVKAGDRHYQGRERRLVCPTHLWTPLPTEEAAPPETRYILACTRCGRIPQYTHLVRVVHPWRGYREVCQDCLPEVAMETFRHEWAAWERDELPRYVFTASKKALAIMTLGAVGL